MRKMTTTIIMSVCLPVRPYTCKNSAMAGWTFHEICDVIVFLKIFRKKSSFIKV